MPIAPGSKIEEKEVKLAREKPWLACGQMLVLGLRGKISRYSINETEQAMVKQEDKCKEWLLQ